MIKPRVPLRWLLALAVVLTGVWYVVAPHRAYDAVLRSLAARDADGLHQVADLDALKTNFTRDFTAAITYGAARRPDSLNRKMLAMVDPMVETALTTQGLAQIVASLGMATDSVAGAGAAHTDLRPVTSFRYRSPVRVDVRVRPAGAPESATAIYTFQLKGVRWQLVRVWSERIAALSRN